MRVFVWLLRPICARLMLFLHLSAGEYAESRPHSIARTREWRRCTARDHPFRSQSDGFPVSTAGSHQPARRQCAFLRYGLARRQRQCDSVDTAGLAIVPQYRKFQKLSAVCGLQAFVLAVRDLAAVETLLAKQQYSLRKAWLPSDCAQGTRAGRRHRI